MTTLELDIIGEVPAELELGPLEAVFAALKQRTDELKLPSDGTINLTFGDDEAIRTLNRDHAGHDYATDVLSFSYIEDGEAIEGVVGEMMISLETATRQAAVAKTDLGTEVALLALHGALHIAGYDHQDEAQREVLEAIQSDIMTACGLSYRDFQWEK